MWLVTLLSALVVRKDEELDAGDAASTLFRLFRSKHVRDLKLIFHIAFIVIIVCEWPRRVGVFGGSLML